MSEPSNSADREEQNDDQSKDQLGQEEKSSDCQGSTSRREFLLGTIGSSMVLYGLTGDPADAANYVNEKASPVSSKVSLQYSDALKLLRLEKLETTHNTNFNDRAVPYSMHGFGAKRLRDLPFTPDKIMV